MRATGRTTLVVVNLVACKYLTVEELESLSDELVATLVILLGFTPTQRVNPVYWNLWLVLTALPSVVKAGYDPQVFIPRTNDGIFWVLSAVDAQHIISFSPMHRIRIVLRLQVVTDCTPVVRLLRDSCALVGVGHCNVVPVVGAPRKEHLVGIRIGASYNLFHHVVNKLEHFVLRLWDEGCDTEVSFLLHCHRCDLVT